MRRGGGGGGGGGGERERENIAHSVTCKESSHVHATVHSAIYHKRAPPIFIMRQFLETTDQTHGAATLAIYRSE